MCWYFLNLLPKRRYSKRTSFAIKQDIIANLEEVMGSFYWEESLSHISLDESSKKQKSKPKQEQEQKTEASENPDITIL